MAWLARFPQRAYHRVTSQLPHTARPRAKQSSALRSDANKEGSHVATADQARRARRGRIAGAGGQLRHRWRTLGEAPFVVEGQERDPVHRGRDGRLRGHGGPLLPVRRGGPYEHRQAAATRASRPRGRSSRRPARRTSPTTTPTRRPPARCGRPARRRSTSGSRRVRAARETVPGQEPARRSSSVAQERRQEDRQRLDGRDHRRDAGGARTRTSRCVDARARTTRATTCPTETKAAGGLGSIAEQTVDHKVDVVLGGGARPLRRRPIDRRPRPARPSIEYAAGARATRTSTDAAGLAAAQALGKPLLGLFNAGNMTTEWTGPQATLGEGTPAQRCVTDQPAGRTSRACRR